MSYLVLARKYRPRNFSELVGQEHVVRALSNALTQQRLHHAYLFTGTRGVGKTTVSRILAKSLNCQGLDGQGGITATPCGACQACRDIDAGRFVDYTELDAASNRGVDEVQALLEQAVYKPVMGRFKVFMIDEVHMLTGHAFNAMLKTLEEPPEYLKFVLATTDPQKVPVTVLSRCLQFNLRPMAPETVREHLEHVLQAEGVSAEPQALHLLARAARGSMRDALSLTDQAIAFGAGNGINDGLKDPMVDTGQSEQAAQIQTDAVRHMLGAVDRSYAYRLIEALAHSQGATLVDICQSLRQNGLSAAAALEEVCSVLQRMAVAQFAPQTMAVADPDEAEAQRLAAIMPADETQLLYSLCLQGRSDLGLAPDEYAALTMVMLRLLAFQAPSTHSQAVNEAEKKSPEFDRLSQAESNQARAAPKPRLQTLAPEKKLEANSVAAQPDITAAPMAAEADTQPQPEPQAPKQVRVELAEVKAEDPLGELWEQTVISLIKSDAVQALTRQLALQSCLLTQDSGAWRLGVTSESLVQTDLRDKLLLALQNAGAAISDLKVELTSPAQMRPSTAQRLQAAENARQAAAEAAVLADPLVQALMNEWDAKIVPGSVKPLNPA
jgi:DNA polymerase III subunit gamma/tau